MTAPRQILPGNVWFITRRCAQREFLLAPSEETNTLFLFLLAVAAARTGVLVHVACVMSNHFHLVVTDPEARLPEFCRFLCAFVARVMNKRLGRRESFWGPGSYSAIELGTPEDVIEKAAYVLANPVSAGLVRSGREWPGVWTPPERIGGAGVEVARPADFFNPGGTLPATATLCLAAPAGFDSAAQFRELLEAAIAGREALAAEKHDDAFAGVERVLAADHTIRATAEEKPRKLHPRVASRDPVRRRALLERLGSFLAAYREAWRKWCDGDRAVTFPPGTYLLRVAHGAVCEGFG